MGNSPTDFYRMDSPMGESLESLSFPSVPFPAETLRARPQREEGWAGEGVELTLNRINKTQIELSGLVKSSLIFHSPYSINT